MVRKSNNCCLSIVIFVFPALVIYLNVSSGGPGFKSRPGDSSSRHSRYQNGHYKPASEPINWTVENDKMAARMASRLKTLKENCEKFGLSLPSNDSLHRANTWEFLINKQYRLVWCNVFKAASSSWLFNFNVLAGYSPQFLRRQSQAPALSLARVKYPRPSLSDLESAVSDPAGSVTFVIVRHPFERLLSAYRDKIYNSLPNTVHRSLSSMILRKYRPQAANKSNSRRATFEEFVLYLLDTFRSEETPPGLDMHWAPIVTFCTPCLVNFNVILKFETLQEDQRYLIDLAGVSHLIKPEWLNESKGGATTNQMIGKFYAELSADQLYQLYNVYKYDFELFDYTMEEYLEYVRYP